MTQSVAAFQRCPRCGNENTADSFACNFCGFRLKIERIEKVGFFKRYEAEWINPYPWYLKILYLYINPSRGFWDINHKRSKAPGGLILLFCSLLYGVMGLAFFSHFTFPGWGLSTLTQFLLNVGVFASFFLFGISFQFIFFAVLIWLFTKGANYAVGFSKRLETRFGGLKDTQEKYKAAEISPFSIYKGGTMLQLEASYKFKMMLCAFTPFLLVNAIKALIALVGFGSVAVIDISDPADDIDLLDFMFALDIIFGSVTWAILDVIDALTIAIWVPILITLAIRELSNSSTTRVLVPTIIIGVIIAILFYFLRPTLFG